MAGLSRLAGWWRLFRDGGGLVRLLETFALADGELPAGDVLLDPSRR